MTLLQQKFAVWTPELSERNGQNIVTERVVTVQSKRVGKIYAYNGKGALSVISTLSLGLRLFTATMLRRNAGVYLICSRSTLGFVRDVPVLAASLFGRRIIAHVHGSDFPSLLCRPFIGWIARKFYRACEVIVPSVHMLPELEKHRFKRLTVSENFASGALDFSHRAAVDGGQKPVTVLWNSNIMSSKGVRETADGVRIAHERGYAVKLIMLGKPIGDTEKSKMEMAQFAAGIARCEWADVRGSVSVETVSDLLETSDIVALPSTYSSECQPLSLIQAMIAGCAIIVSDTPALRATVGDYPAIFVERDGEAIATALQAWSRKDAREGLREAAKAALARFSPAAFDARIADALSLQPMEKKA